jgi:hypothetical protein
MSVDESFGPVCEYAGTNGTGAHVDNCPPPQKMYRKVVENASCISNTNAVCWLVAERILYEDCNNLHSSHNI